MLCEGDLHYGHSHILGQYLMADCLIDMLSNWSVTNTLIEPRALPLTLRCCSEGDSKVFGSFYLDKKNIALQHNLIQGPFLKQPSQLGNALWWAFLQRTQVGLVIHLKVKFAGYLGLHVLTYVWRSFPFLRTGRCASFDVQVLEPLSWKKSLKHDTDGVDG